MAVQQKRNSRMFMMLGIVLTLLAMGGVYFIAQSSSKSAQVTTVSVLVATRLVPDHTTFANATDVSNWFTVAPFPAKTAPVGSFSSPAAFVTGLLHSGRRANTEAIFAGEPVVASMFTDLGTTRTAYTWALELPKHDVAISMEVTTVDGVAGAILPGDSIDIMASYLGGSSGSSGDASGSAPPQTQYLLQNIKVLATGNISGPPASGAKSTTAAPTGGSGLLTLEVDHQTALVLQHIKDLQSSWHLSVVLRSGRAKGVFQTTPVINRWYFQRLANNFTSHIPY